MSKHHIENLAEQISKKGHASSPWKIAMEDSSVQHTAYQIHQEKGGTALDNWLEAERKLKNAEINGLSKGG